MNMKYYEWHLQFRASWQWTVPVKSKWCERFTCCCNIFRFDLLLLTCIDSILCKITVTVTWLKNKNSLNETDCLIAASSPSGSGLSPVPNLSASWRRDLRAINQHLLGRYVSQQLPASETVSYPETVSTQFFCVWLVLVLFQGKDQDVTVWSWFWGC